MENMETQPGPSEAELFTAKATAKRFILLLSALDCDSRLRGAMAQMVMERPGSIPDGIEVLELAHRMDDPGPVLDYVEKKNRDWKKSPEVTGNGRGQNEKDLLDLLRSSDLDGEAKTTIIAAMSSVPDSNFEAALTSLREALAAYGQEINTANERFRQEMSAAQTDQRKAKDELRARQIQELKDFEAKVARMEEDAKKR